MWLLLCLVLLCGQASAVRLEPGIHIASKNKVLPVVLWHGMGDSCCSSYSMGAIKSLIEDRLGVFVLSIATGSTEALDVWSSYFGDVNDQVGAVCEQIRGIPELQNGYNAIGFSQGGQFIRALVQRCQHKGPKAHTVITMGAQHQGVMTIPGCEVMSPAGGVDSLHSQAACKAMQAMLSRGAYIDVVQSRVVQAQYFKDPHHLDAYLRHSIFLADINNEHEKKSEQYRRNLLSLEALVLYRFAEDKTVVPRDSSWFGFYNGTALQPLQEQALYSEDWLGLRELDEGGRLVFAEAPGGHMHFTLEWFEQVMSQYLN